jgi:subtilisin family serine protease
MKLSSAAIFLMLSLSSLSSVSAKPKDKKKGGNKGNDKKPPLSADDDVELVVRYRNEKGIDDLKVKANDGTVEKVISKRYKVAALKTKRFKMNQIANHPDIETVAESQTYHALPYTRGGQVQDERNLVDLAPYGIGLVQADQLVQGPNKVTVCVIDTGYGLGHPDLPNITYGVEGYSPYGTDEERWDVDGNSHGTHCAGTIGAIGSNDIGVTSVNPDPDKFTFFIGKGLRNSGSGPTASIIAAVDECVTAGAKVISMSLGCAGNCFTAVEQAVLKDAYDDGVLIIAAAGNRGDGTLGYPASYATVMSVGAVDINENIASFSQHNKQVEISAPGVGIRSTITTDGGTKFSYASYSGTSMATPHVAGVAALVWSHFPRCSNNQIRNVLIKTSMDRGLTGCDEYYGHGIVQAKAAYDLLNTTGCTAGGVDPSPLSNGATGGCEQYPDSLPPSTSSPTKSPTSSPTKSPTSAPVTPPTDAPTKTPTSAPVTPPPVNTGCLGTETNVRVYIKTDNYPDETQWTIFDWLSNVTVGAGGPYDVEGGTFTEDMCIPKGCYVFNMTDKSGDGICCGFGDGSYSLEVDGVSLVSEGGEFLQSAFTLFGNCLPAVDSSASASASASVASVDKKEKPTDK